MLCLLIVNVGAATGRLVTSLYRTVSPERQCHQRRVEVTDIYIFRNKGFFSSRGFLDIEKSVLLELKGVKVIRSYRDFFQLIRDFLRINDTFRLFYMISLLFTRVINLIIVIVIVNNFCIVMVRIYNFVENKGIFQ